MIVSPSTPAAPDSYRRLWLVFYGLFLGLTLLKFGNPVILDRQIPPPSSMAEALSQPWPLRWSFGIFVLLAFASVPLVRRAGGSRWRRLPCSLWVPLLLWLGWQFLSASQTVDGALTTLTLWHLVGVVTAYALGVILWSDAPALRWVLAGVLVGFCFCLMRATTQRLVEFPADREILLEGQNTGWTNFPPAVVATMKLEGTILHTNGVDIANPLILSKLERGRVHGTLVYPNALAGAVLLLLPVALQLVGSVTRDQRPVIRWAALGLLGALGFAALLWSGSKSGWLIALAASVAVLFRLPLPRRFKLGLLLTLVGGGLLVFGLRFQGYFAAGATSVGARFDYWRAAAQTALDYPLTGTGPGTFQRPYARLKSPEAEMARLVHNDYLEQFSDSGWVGGLAYLGWAVGWLGLVGMWTWRQADWFWFSAFLGVAAWLIQGLSEFGLYVPALAWTAFTLAGALAGATTQLPDSSSRSKAN